METESSQRSLSVLTFELSFAFISELTYNSGFNRLWRSLLVTLKFLWNSCEKMKKKLLLIKNGIVITLGEKNKIIHNGALLIEENIIKKVGKISEFKEIDQSVEVIDAKGKLIMPGFINTHTHFYSTFARGLMPKQPAAKNFVEILKKLWWPLDNALNEKDIYYSTIVAAINGIKRGTTTFFDHHESQSIQQGIMDVIEEPVKKVGVRANLSLGISDRYKKGKDGIKENVRFIEKINKHKKLTKDELISAMFGLHALFTVNETSLNESAAIAKSLGVGLHVHTAEDISDQIVNKNRYGKRVIKRLYDTGGLGKNTIAVHCVHLDDKEMDLLASTNTVVVHNPQSNMNNAVGVANVLKMLDKKITIGLGTDGMSSGMQDDVKVANLLHKHNCKDPRIFFRESCSLLLENNAKIANRFFTKKLGELKEDTYADIILIDYLAPTPLNESTFSGHFLFGICEAPVDTTIINGKVIMKERKLLNIDEEKIFAESRNQAENFWKRF